MFKYKYSIIGLLSITFIFISFYILYSQNTSSSIRLARLKYSGGADWYNDPSGEVNLLKYVRNNTNIPVEPTYEYVDLATDNLFIYPLVFLTGHGNINLTEQEINNLKTYLENGGFLFIDDDYGLDQYIHKQMKKVFPEQEFIELPFSHGIYSSHFKFNNGVPKIHEHDDKPPRGYGLFYQGRLCVFYAYESNIGDGWVDSNVYNDPEEVRENALKMGTNIIVWALTN